MASRTPTWVVEKVKKRDGGECRNCPAEEDLQIHHIVPLSNGGRQHPSNAVLVCGDCHERIHGRSEGELQNHGQLISNGVQKRIKNDDEYHHGPAPLGFEKDSGRLLEGPEYHRVVSVLEDVARGETSKRQAAGELDTSRRTIQRAIEDRADLYGL